MTLPLMVAGRFGFGRPCTNPLPIANGAVICTLKMRERPLEPGLSASRVVCKP